jgi:hypothetical protein
MLKPQRKKKNCLPQLVPLLRTGRRSKAVAATVLLDVLGNVLPGKLGTTSAVVRTLGAKLSSVSDATAQEADLLRSVSVDNNSQHWGVPTSLPVHTGFLTRSDLSFVRTRTRPRKVDSASGKLPMTLMSL